MASKQAGSFSAELLDQLLSGRDPATVLESGGLIGDLKKALAERMLNAELDVHLCSDGEVAAGNHRNGTSAKTVLTPDGAIELSIPRYRHGRFDPALIAKHRRRFPGFDEKIIALYARSMSTRDIQAHVHELYGIELLRMARERHFARDFRLCDLQAPPTKTSISYPTTIFGNY